MEVSKRRIRHPNDQVWLNSYYIKRQHLGLECHVKVILKMFCIVGIDIARTRKVLGLNKLKIMFRLFYRWLMCILMLYFLAARMYKAAQPNVPLMLSFSETVATASSTFLRFIILGKRTSLNKLLRSLHTIQTDEELFPPASYLRREKVFFMFSLGGFLLTMALSTTKAVSELLSPQGFQLYRKSYLFAASFKNDTLLYKATNSIVYLSHILYIFNIYSVPSLVLLLCCYTCNGIGFFNLTLKAKLDENRNILEWSPPFMRTCISHFKKMHAYANRAEAAFSVVLFFLYSYLLCSLFYIVSLTIRNSRGQNDIRRTYIVAALLNLILFYVVLSVSVAKVRETVYEVRSDILQKTDNLSPSELATLFVNVREFTRDVNLTGWGVFTIDRNFILASAGVVVSYGVVLAQLSNY